jgi:arylsulfatase A-like enzyme
VTDKLAIVRSMTHTDSAHERGYHIMMTGAAPRQADFNSNVNDNNHHPSFGAMVARLSRPGKPLPPYISVPNFLPSGGPAFLGASCAPFVIESDPASPDFAVRDVVLPAGVSQDRAARRQDALREINRLPLDAPAASRPVRALDTFYEKAHGLMTSRQAQEAFDIHREPQKLREEYGLTSIGQCCLLARRLVEAGCRFVTIEHGHWDTHRKNTWSLKELLVPDLDRAVPALLNDLGDRGLLEKTLVVVATEFGRTPRINQLAGRDHWPAAFSVCLAGAGIKTGQVIGATDHHAARVTDRPVTPQDLAATILSRLGIDPHTTLHTSLGRPIELVNGGKPIEELG